MYKLRQLAHCIRPVNGDLRVEQNGHTRDPYDIGPTTSEEYCVGTKP